MASRGTKLLRVLKTDASDFETSFAEITDRRPGPFSGEKDVRKIVERVREGTQALFAASLPSHPDEEREELVLSGEVPTALDPPTGCRFHPRCPFVMPHCSGDEPSLKEVAPDHFVACYLT